MVDQSNPVSGGGTQILAHMPIGQEFTPSQPILVAVDVFFRGGGGEEDIITVNIRKGSISSVILATTSQTVAPCPFAPPYTCLVHFDLPSPLAVTPSEIYVLELQASRTFHAWQSGFGPGDYPGGSPIIQGAVASLPDFGFQTYFDTVLDEDADGIPSPDDCDDSDPFVFPGAREFYDATDNNCDGLLDEGLDDDSDGIPNFYDACNGTGLGVGVSSDGCPVCAVDPDLDADGFPASLDCSDSDAGVHPGAGEVCDRGDNDCDGLVDEGFDSDGDGFSVCAVPLRDCNDSDPAIKPGSLELPGNSIDENCDSSLGPCDPYASWRNHGEFVRCVTAACGQLMASGALTHAQCGLLVGQAGRSGVGK